MRCIGCMEKSGDFASQLGLCDVCQWYIYDHIKQHSSSGRHQNNYDLLDRIKRDIADDARCCSGGDVAAYLANNSSSFIRFQKAISFSYENGGRYMDWARTLNNLGASLDICSTKDAY